MIITVSGEAGSGKSTCARRLSKIFDLKHYSSGDLMRTLAKEKGMNLEEFSKVAEKSPEIDCELDERQKNLGKTEDQFIIDGRLSAFFIPHAIKIFITADLDERAKRIFNAKRSSELTTSIEEAKALIEKRKESEIKRYQTWYGFNPYDPKLYDIVYDSTGKPISKMIEEVTKKINLLASKNKN